MNELDLAAGIIDGARHALSPGRPGPRIEPAKRVLWSEDASRIVREWEDRKRRAAALHPRREVHGLRTIRRYAHELYPEGEEGETRDLAVEVPYLLARTLGLNVWGTGFMDAGSGEHAMRAAEFVITGRLALVADALLQGMSGQQAWEWADQRSGGDNLAEWAYERAVAYGIDPHRIKPYPCGPEPSTHYHKASTGNVLGEGTITSIGCPESECPDCTEAVRDEH